MTLGRAVAVLGIAVGLIGLGINFYLLVGMLGTEAPVTLGAPVKLAPRSPVAAFIDFWTFFTHLTNLGLVLVYLSELTAWRWLAWFRGPIARASMAAHITLVMLFFHVLLAPLYRFEGGLLVANTLLHYVAPILFLVWWAVFTPHGTLRFAQIPTMLSYGAAYIAYVMVRGAIIGKYPYAIIDVTKSGYVRVAVALLALTFAVAVLGAILVLADRLLARRNAAAAQ